MNFVLDETEAAEPVELTRIRRIVKMLPMVIEIVIVCGIVSLNVTVILIVHSLQTQEIAPIMVIFAGGDIGVATA